MGSHFDRLIACCREAASFPLNLVNHDDDEYQRREYHKRLEERSDKLFTTDDAAASMELYELSYEGESNRQQNVEIYESS